MRVLHTSDWHLGRVLGGHSLEEDQAHALGQVEATIAATDPDLVVIAGDVFDRATPPPEAMRRLGDWLHRVISRKPGLPIVAIAGNHDNGTRLAWSAALLDRQGVHLRGETDTLDEPIRVRGRDGVDAEVFAIPFLWPGSMREAEPSQAAAMDEALRRVRARQTPGMAQILVAHCFVHGGEASDSERGFVGTATRIDPGSFAGFDYVALGHLHRPQRVGENARYSGSLARYSFSEAAHEKAVLVAEVVPGQAPVVQEQRLNALRPMRRLRGSLEELRDDPRFEPGLDDYVELALDPPVAVGNPLAVLRERWSRILAFRNEVGPAEGALARVGGDAEGPRDLAADWGEFDAQFPGGDASPELRREAFSSLLARMPQDAR